MWSLAVLELEAEHLLHRTADDVVVAEPGQLARAAAAPISRPSWSQTKKAAFGAG